MCAQKSLPPTYEKYIRLYLKVGGSKGLNSKIQNFEKMGHILAWFSDRIGPLLMRSGVLK